MYPGTHWSLVISSAEFPSACSVGTMSGGSWIPTQTWAPCCWIPGWPWNSQSSCFSFLVLESQAGATYWDTALAQELSSDLCLLMFPCSGFTVRKSVEALAHADLHKWNVYCSSWPALDFFRVTVPEPHPLSILGQIENTVTHMYTQLVLQKDQVPLREPAQKYRLSSGRLSWESEISTLFFPQTFAISHIPLTPSW